MADRCRACQAEIRWVVMESGKRNPLNAERDPERGNVAIDVDGRGLAFGPEKAAELRRLDVDLYLSHFATCPEREQFRR